MSDADKPIVLTERRYIVDMAFVFAAGMFTGAFFQLIVGAL